MHGLLVDGRLWRKVTPLLEDRFRCIVPELPLGSHPEPLNPDADLSPRGWRAIVAGFLEGLDLRDVTLVGNDTGGAISQITAANHPERIGRLLLTNCDAFENFLPRPSVPAVGREGARRPDGDDGRDALLGPSQAADRVRLADQARLRRRADCANGSIPT